MFLQGPTKKHVVYAEDLTDNIYTTVNLLNIWSDILYY